MKFTYPKTEKLKRHAHIQKLFSEGKAINHYPLRLIFTPIDLVNADLVFGVSVSKKKFKHAHDRNYCKRLMRECYRKNKMILNSKIKSPMAFMLIYQSNEMINYKELEEKVREIFEKYM